MEIYCTLPWETCTSHLKRKVQMPQREDGLPYTSHILGFDLILLNLD